MKFFKKFNNKEEKVGINSRDAAKERLHLVLMQDRANVSADFLELMKQEIIEVIKKYIDVDEGAIDVRLTNKENEDGTNGVPALYANIPILNIKNEARKVEEKTEKKVESKKEVTKKEEKPTKEATKKNTEKATKKQEKEETVEVIIKKEEEQKQIEQIKKSEPEKIEKTEEELKSEN